MRVQLGTIDNSYTENLGIIVDNIDYYETYTIPKGYELAQLVVSPVIYPEVEEADDLEDTDRSNKGFGSTRV